MEGKIWYHGLKWRFRKRQETQTLYAVTKASFCAGLVALLASFLTAQCPPGDLNHNCTVDLPDLVIFAEQWMAPPGCAGHLNECADFYFDDGVNLYDFEFLTHAWGRHVPPVVINEFLADNHSRPPLEPGEQLDEDGDSSDWIELYNLSGAPVELGGWILTIDPDHKKVWIIPAGVSLRGGEYLVLFASEKNRTAPNKQLHTNFVLNKEGSYLALIEPDGVTIASEFAGFEFAFGRFGYPPQETNVSYGRLETDLRYFSRPTPGAANNGEFLGFVGPITASRKHGFFTQAFEVRLSCQTPDAKIRFTTDGSNPTEANGADYDPAKLIAIAKTTVLRAAAFKTGYQPSRTETNTYLFLDDVILQSPDGAKPTKAWPDPYHEYNRQWIDYGMDPEVVNDPRYAGQMLDALKAIPSISITTDLSNLFNPDWGIYVHAWADGREWERPCSMELINPDATEGFQVNAGLRIRGGFSRSSDNPKHAFRLFFGSQYGDSSLNYPLFGDEGVSSFDKIDLRTDQNYSWSFRGRNGMDNGSKNTMVREVFSRDTQGEMGQPYTRSRHYHLYLNGQYWGIYQTEERSESRFAQDYLGGDSSQYDVTKVDADFSRYIVAATDGNTNAYRILWKAAIDGFETDAAYYGIQGLNPDGTPNPSKKKWLDVDNLIDYMAIIYYTGNYDAPLSNFLGNQRPNNYFAIVNRQDPDGWKFICHDAEHSLFLGWDRTGPWESPDLRKFEYFNPQWLHQQLCAHPEYRMRFADRIHKYFFNDGLLTPDKAMQRFKARADRIQMAILGESARWGDSKVNKPRTKDDDWLPEITRLYEDYFPYRTDEVLQQLIGQGWYPTTIAPIFYIGQKYQHGGMVTPPDNVLNIINPNITGTLYYTLDGTDPRLLAAPPSPSSAQPASDTPSAQGSTDLGAASTPPPADDDLGNADIAWITDTELDKKFTDLLKDHGYSVDRYEMLMRGPLDPYRASMLNKAKLIIISSATLDISYDDPEGWNSITTPLILMNASLARSNRWDWVDSAAAMSHEPTDLWTPVPEDLLFFGLSMTGGNSVNVVTGNTTFVHVNEDQFGWPNYGNPKAFRIDEATPYLWIAQWDSWWNDPFYWGTDQKPAGGRMLLSMGGGLDTLKPFNLNSSGEKLFLNAVEIMLHYDDPQEVNFSPYVWAGWDENVMWPDKEVELFGYVFDDGMLPDPNELTWVWSKVEGPGEVTIVKEIVEPHEFIWGPYTYRYVFTFPTISFSEAGIYELKLEAFDGEFYSSDTTVVKVLEPAASLTLTKSTRVKARILGEDGVWSALNEATYGMGPVAESLRISEIHYHPDGDPNSEFIEVVNAGNQSINISWAAFTEGIHFEFPDIDLAPGKYSVVVRNRAAFEKRYGTSIPVAGEYSGNLDNLGEKIALRDAIGTVIHSFKFSDGWYPTTDGQGFSLTFRNPKTTDPAAWAMSSSWRPSSLVGGSPGSDDDGLVPPPGTIVINELLAHSHDSAADWIELYNTTPDTVNIGGWFLSDSNADDPNRMKFEIPEGTTIGGHSYKVFYQDADFGNPANSACHAPFALSENGEAVYLRSRLDNTGHFTGYFVEQKFDASLVSVSFGRHVNSDGSFDFVAQSRNTPNEANAYPQVGPIVISEIYYNPPTGGTYASDEYEFIELMNITSAPVTFQSLDNELNTDLPWAIDEGIQFVFPLNTTLGAYKRMILARNSAAFAERFGSGLPAGTVVLQWTSGKLNNAGEKLQLSQPGDKVGATRYYIPIDTVKYSDQAPWPVSADGTGPSLYRKLPTFPGKNYGNDPANWSASTPTPGR